MRPTLLSIGIHLKHQFKRQRETIGVNLAALQLLQKQIADATNKDFSAFFDAPGNATDPFHE